MKLSDQDFGRSSCPLRRRQWQPTPVPLPGKSHGRRSLVSCSPWGHEKSDMTERLHFPFSLSCIGEGNGNPLQCSCLENPRDGGAWWAAIYRVAQGRTLLKQLSSSSCCPLCLVTTTKAGRISRAYCRWKKSNPVSSTMPKPLTVWIIINCGKLLKRWEYQTILPVSKKPVCGSRSKNQGQEARS